MTIPTNSDAIPRGARGIVDRIEGLIEEEGLGSRDRLPPERRLAEMLGVSRPSSARPPRRCRPWAGCASTRCSVRAWRRQLSIPGRRRRSLVEHRRILRAIAAGNAVAARRAMREHITSAQRVAVSRLGSESRRA